MCTVLNSGRKCVSRHLDLPAADSSPPRGTSLCFHHVNNVATHTIVLLVFRVLKLDATRLYKEHDSI